MGTLFVPTNFLLCHGRVSVRHLSRALSCLLLCLPLAAPAAPLTVKRLNDFINNVQGMQADFHQLLIDNKSKAVKESSGTLVMQRPGKFRWEYTRPYRQTIVADGERIWIYDVELEQVTVKPLDTTLGGTPAVLLSGQKTVWEQFKVKELGSKDGLEWVELTPKAPDNNFESVRLGFGAHDLEMMELLDSFGATTQLRFSKLQRNPVLDSSAFVFTSPKGVDVIGEDAATVKPYQK